MTPNFYMLRRYFFSHTSHCCWFTTGEHVLATVVHSGFSFKSSGHRMKNCSCLPICYVYLRAMHLAFFVSYVHVIIRFLSQDGCTVALSKHRLLSDRCAA